MELGQTLCTPRNPNCRACPVKRFCHAKEPAALPVRKPPARHTELTEHAIFARRPDGTVLLQQAGEGRRRGLWRLPLRLESSLAGLPLLATSRYTITRYRVTLHIHRADPAALPPAAADDHERWHNPAELAAAPMAAPFRRAADSLLAIGLKSRKNRR